MAGTTSSIISQLISSIQSLFNLRLASSSLPASSSSSALAAAGTTAQVNLFQENFMNNLRRLERMLRRVQAVLRDAEKREIHDETIQLWLSELREVAYDAEDALDEYNYQVLKTQVEGMAAAEAEPSLKRKREDDDDDPEGYQVCLSISKAIRKIVEKFDEISKDREALQLREEDGVNRLTPRKRPVSSSLLVHDSVVFGREDDKKRIIQLLMSDSEEECSSNISVIPVVGMGGVGKTTLIQLVYNDPTVFAHFSPKVWVCVSEEFDVMRVTKEILQSIDRSSSCHINNLNDLQCALKKALQEKRFLLVLDDIWIERPDLWESLRAPFSGVGKGKVIITTRSMLAARIMQTVPPHKLGCLDEEKSWLLFKSLAFCGWEPDEQLDFAEIGRRITMKCGGLPLALKALGEVLRYEVDEQTWLDVLNNDLWELEKTNKHILPALRISYEHLPAHLRPCFVYASLFPKDFFFDRTELIRLWMAQGYIQPEGKRLLEDIASEYFDELQRRSLFQGSTFNDVSERFVLHDMVHDLARSISENKIYSMFDLKQLKNIPKDAKHIFLRLTKNLDLEYDMATVFSMFDALRTFRLEIWDDTFKYDHEGYILGKQVKDLFPRFSCLRALKIYAPQFTINLQFVSWISNLKHLRFLAIDVRSMQMVDDSFTSLYNLQTLELTSNNLMLPHGMGKLINLRHLVLRCSVEMLPESICQLQNLLTLDIQGCPDLRELPLDLSKLINLQHLMLPFKCCIPSGIVKLTNLQTLYNVYFCQHSKIGWLGHLVNLRGRLRISGLRNVLSYEDAMSVNLQSKPHIKHLVLVWRTHACTQSKKVMHSYNDVDECTLGEEAVLGGLHPHTHLEYLEILSYGGNRFPNWFGNPSFSKLTTITLNYFLSKDCKFLPLSRLPSLKYLKVLDIKGIKIMGHDFWCYPHPDGHENNSTSDGFNEMRVGFPSLETLIFVDMPEWEEWRMQNGDFPNLKILHIAICPKLLLLPTLPARLEYFNLNECGSLRNLTLYDSSECPSSLQKLTILNCPQLESLQQVPDLTEFVIKRCSSLKSVNIMHNLLTTLKVMTLHGCPLLQLTPDECLLHSIPFVSIKLDGGC